MHVLCDFSYCEIKIVCPSFIFFIANEINAPDICLCAVHSLARVFFNSLQDWEGEIRMQCACEVWELSSQLQTTAAQGRWGWDWVKNEKCKKKENKEQPPEIRR